MTTPETVFKEFSERLRQYLARQVSSPEDVNDLLQEVFLRVVRHEKTLTEVKKPLAWLYTITKSVLVDYYRKAEIADLKLKVLRDEETEVDETPSYDSEFANCVLPLIKNLPDKYQQVIWHIDIGGERQTDFSVRNGVNVSTVKSRVQRARKMLKNDISGCCQIQFDQRKNISSLTPNCSESDKCC